MSTIERDENSRNRAGGYQATVIANCCNHPSFHFTCLFSDKFVSWHIANFSMEN